MEAIATLISKLFERMGIFWTLVICSVVVLLFYLGKGTFMLFVEWARQNFKHGESKMDKEGLLKHPVFLKFHYLTSQRFKQLQCQCPLRRKIFCDLMTIRINSYNRILREFIENERMEEMSEAEFKFALCEATLLIFESWQKEAEEKQIPKPVIDALVCSVDDIRKSLVSIIQSSAGSYGIYRSNFAKMYAVLDVVNGFEELSLIHLEAEMDDMNGEISESQYKGIQCLHCRHCVSKKHVPEKDQCFDGNDKLKE